MVEPLSLIFRVFTAKISGIPKFRHFMVVGTKKMLQGLHCLLFYLHHLEVLDHGRTS